VDWSILSESPDYFTAVANAQLTSDLTAELIDFLVDNEFAKIEDFHIIGFSLGGQVVGQIGKKVSHRLQRITGNYPLPSHA
jgi:dienelactone hydrolase